jgi:DNA-binding MarR family transcriptional regulator
MQHELAHLLRTLDRILKRSIDKRVEDTGVYRSQHRLLMTLGRSPGISQTELAERMEISAAAVTVSLKKLEKSGFISRQCDENDNRVNQVVITEKGKKAIDKSIQYFDEIEDAFFSDFTQQEMEQVEVFFRRMAANGENYYQSILKQES